jgi:S1-C subfamily serine protease
MYVVTNEHIIREAREEYGSEVAFSVDFQPPIPTHLASVVALEPDHDLALLQTAASWTHDMGIARERTARPRVGVRVFSMGYAQDRIASWDNQLDSEGVVARLPGFEVGRGVLHLEPVPPDTIPWVLIAGFGGTWGSSGSPVFNEDGALLGYVSHQWRDISQAIPGTTLPDHLHVAHPVSRAIAILRIAASSHAR